MSAVNPTVGHIKCAWCGNTCEVRESIKNKLYYVCSASAENEGCGQFMMAYKGGQKIMHEHTVFLEDKKPAKKMEVKKETSKQEEPTTTTTTEDAPADVGNEPVKKSFFDFD